MYKILNCNYNRQALIDLFSRSNKAKIKSLYQITDDIIDEPAVSELFDICNFVPRNRFNIEIGTISQYVPPYISPGNNGLIIFPLLGELSINFYSYPATRETLSPYKKLSPGVLVDIERTLIKTVTVDQPTMFDGTVPHSYGSSNSQVLIAILKIPLGFTWQDITSDI